MTNRVHIKRLWFRDFPGLKEVRLDLPDGPATVFVGANGAGKSSVLEGTAILLSRLAARIRSPQSGGRQIGDEDVHNEASDAEIGIRIRLGNDVAEWTVVKTKHGRAVRERSELDQLKELARRAFDRRLEADYAELVTFTTEEAEDTLTQARAFVDRVRSLLPDVLPG